MKAAIYETFGGPVAVRQVDDPSVPAHGAVLKVAATGICRSDWHGWMGHDADIELPHVPGHEFAGVVEAVGADVRKWQAGARVTVPFVCACGSSTQCRDGNQQICDRQTQPGFTHWGSYAEYVAIDHADINLVALPDDVDFVTAASLGCRFATAWRAVVAQGRTIAGEWVAVHGCGGVGLSAIMIARALGAQVVAIDIDADALAMAEKLGAAVRVDAGSAESVVDAVAAASDGGAHVSLDALGSSKTCQESIACLRKRGRHVQVGLLAGEDYRPALPMELVIARELEIVGSHGLQAREYAGMLDMIVAGRLHPEKLLGRTISLEDAAAALHAPGHYGAGVTVIDRI